MFNFPELEEKVLKDWQTKDIFKKTLAKDAPKGVFSFYEGPPTANGKPGIHHVLARAFKDLIPRFKTMQGYFVERKAGWDTHGLPVELQVEKKLGISGKPQIEEYGVEEFNKQCRASVWEYQAEWEKLTERIGFWLDLENPYVTYHQDYIESLWYIFKQVHDKGLLYQGHKVVPHCPRCGTALSSHEVAQGYKEVTEPSVYVKFKVLARGQNSTNVEAGDYILSWTTTPWTLPGNVALAVGKKFDYVKIKILNSNSEILNNDQNFNIQTQNFILAKDIFEKWENKDDFEIVAIIKGSELIGVEYEPLFPGAIPSDVENYQNAFKVYPADFVTTADGTGVVHTAVMYGEDDYNLGTEVGLPKYHTVDENGKFIISNDGLKGRFVKNKEVEQTIINYLKESNLFFNEVNYTHDYPFCWRCDTPLLYYAKNSWFFKMSALRDQLIKENQKINWIPEHIKDGRFGEWLSQVKDWAISRERYWGTPLPIWQCEICQAIKVIGSYAELQKNSETKLTKLFFVRHGESEKNILDIKSRALDKYPLTKKGEEHVKLVADKITDKIDIIISSPVLRTKQTAEIMAKKFKASIIYDESISEYNSGSWDEISHQALLNNADYLNYKKLDSFEEKFNYRMGENGETRSEIVARIESFLQKINKEYSGKTILIVSHGGINAAINKILDNIQLEQFFLEEDIAYDKVVSFYINENIKSFDPHRPYIDQYKLTCECGGQMSRVKEVADCWFDSGSMPFAQYHYPFANKDKVDAQDYYPADYIAEAIDQTRGWFYTLLAIGTLLDKGAPYKNVICLGHINDKHGKKMSKSKGNIVDPWEVINQWGADALRFHLYTVNQPGESKNFDIKNVETVVKKNFMILFNVVSFYEMYAGQEQKAENAKLIDSQNVLDQWILAKLNQLITAMTENLEKYDIFTAGRFITEFIDDLSTWYLRRSRDRFKAEDKSDKSAAIATLGYVLQTLSKLMAPFTPFVAEALYQRVGKEKDSVHLESWPEVDSRFTTHDSQILEKMETVRKIVELGLAKRDEVGIKVRQPLNKLKVKGKKEKLSHELLDLVKDEVNVKEVEFIDLDSELLEVELDVALTDELKAEGLLRELIRSINQLRKEAKLTIQDVIEIDYQSDSALVKKVISDYQAELQKNTISKNWTDSKDDSYLLAKELKVNEEELWLGIKKV